ncbi:hypothetical protein GCM10017788_12690 [Amycolatopsis acidiphila]|nr:hypothetical protein GCM10017788_12690 [Amycolatopsis acidiphila]
MSARNARYARLVTVSVGVLTGRQKVVNTHHDGVKRASAPVNVRRSRPHSVVGAVTGRVTRSERCQGGGPAVRRAADRRVRGARADAARTGEAVTGSGLVADIVGAVLALGLIAYLFIALIKPEKF